MHPGTEPQTLAERYAAIRGRIAAAERRFGRAPGSVRLLAVSKGQPAEAVRALAALGQRAFGENYLQEALAKQAALVDLDLEWHFVGHLQANKTRAAAERFAWVHSIDRERVARRLDAQRSAELPPLEVCVQVNVSGEAGKAGVAPQALGPLLKTVASLPRLRLRGLMALPAPSEHFERQRDGFRRLVDLYAAHRRPGWDTLSMGTSADLEAAIAEGATLVRVGTALFGPRLARAAAGRRQ